MTEPIPPRTASTKMSMLAVAAKLSALRPRCWWAKIAPAKPASAPEKAKAARRIRTAAMPKAATFCSLSRRAISTRPKRLLRTLATTTIDSTSAATHRKYIDFSSPKSKKNSVGRSMASGRSQSK